MNTINKFLLIVGMLSSTLCVMANNAAEKAYLERFFASRGTDYQSVIALAKQNTELIDSVNTLCANSFAIVDMRASAMSGTDLPMHGYFTLDGNIPSSWVPGETDIVYFDSTVYNNYFGETAASTINYGAYGLNMGGVEELKKCAGLQAPARRMTARPEIEEISDSVYRYNGLTHAISAGMGALIQIKLQGHVVWDMEKEDQWDQIRCILRSDVLFMALPKYPKLFQTTNIYKSASAKPFIYGESYKKALRLEDLNMDTYGRKVTNGKYGTICLAKKFTNMEGVEGLYIPASKDANYLYCEEVALKDVKAGQAYIFKANADSVTFTLEDEAVTAAVEANNMKGWLSSDYVLQAGDVESGSDFDGYYFLATPEGASEQQIVKPVAGSRIKNHCAVIKLATVPNGTPAPGRRYIKFGMNGTDAATGMVDVNSEFRIQNSKFLKDGQLIIIRDGKMFNAQGQEL